MIQRLELYHILTAMLSQLPVNAGIILSYPFLSKSQSKPLASSHSTNVRHTTKNTTNITCSWHDEHEDVMKHTWPAYLHTHLAFVADAPILRRASGRDEWQSCRKTLKRKKCLCLHFIDCFFGYKHNLEKTLNICFVLENIMPLSESNNIILSASNIILSSITSTPKQ